VFFKLEIYYIPKLAYHVGEDDSGAKNFQLSYSIHKLKYFFFFKNKMK